MQKKLIALAIAGLASTAAFAQTNVTIYGIADIGYNYAGSSDTNTYKARNAIDSGQQSGSRIGFKGTEALGNGLSALFTLEYGLAIDQNRGVGTGTYTTARQQFAGLTGNFGTAVAGRMYTPQYNLVASLDPFAAGTNGDVTFGRGVYTMGATASAQTTRLDNLVAYVSPNFSGFNVVLGYTVNGLANEGVTVKGTDSSDAEIYAINPNYKNGPINIGLNYHHVSIDSLNYTDNVWDLGGSYDFGFMKLAGLYGELSNDSVAFADAEAKQWMLGVTVPIGSNAAFLASYSQNHIDTNISGYSPKADKWAIGGTYNLSKRTNLYATYAHISTNNDAEGGFSVRSAGTDAVFGSGADDFTNGFNLGVRHQF